MHEVGPCAACVAAKGRRWYRENSTLTSAKNGLQAKVKRHLNEDALAKLLAALVGDQGGLCACCGREVASGLNIEWSLDETADDGCPLARAAICRSCKIAVNRIVHPSKYVLTTEHREMVERYLRLPWRDIRPAPIVETGNVGYGTRPDPVRDRALDVAAWLAEISGVDATASQ